ncbi:MAG TPA: peptidylprolyl isomerase [Chloroflexota bacterium]|nr:peptidylprolyl isomerase [Chloroflexota bacterium]
MLALVTTLTVVACQAAAVPTPTTAAVSTPTTGSTTKVAKWNAPPAMTIDPNKQYSALIKTSEGDLTAELFPKDAPITVNNFVFLANQGFYDNVKFHRVIKGFMVQTGDPTGTGSGGPGYRFNDEPVTRKYLRGTLAMANAGPNTNGSQFFIMHQDYPLQPNYTIFGQVTGGLDVLDKLATVPVAASPSGEPSVPQKDLRILSVTITEK